LIGREPDLADAMLALSRHTRNAAKPWAGEIKMSVATRNGYGRWKIARQNNLHCYYTTEAFVFQGFGLGNIRERIIA